MNMRTTIALTLVALNGWFAQNHAADLLYVTVRQISPTPDSFVKTYDISKTTSAEVLASGQVLIPGTHLSNPKGLAFDGNGDLYVSNYASNTIRKFSPQGTLLSSITGNMSGPEDILFDSQGNLYVANGVANNVSKFGPTGTFLGTIAATGTTGPGGLALDSNGSLYVANRGASSSITKWTTSGTLQSTLTGFTNPNSVTFLPNGKFYVANYGGGTQGQVLLMNQAGTTIEQTITHTSVNRPYDVQLDSAGNFYVSNMLDYSISKFNSSGTFQFKWAVGGEPYFMLSVPEPSTYALAAIASGVMALIAHRRKTSRRKS